MRTASIGRSIAPTAAALLTWRPPPASKTMPLACRSLGATTTTTVLWTSMSQTCFRPPAIESRFKTSFAAECRANRSRTFNTPPAATRSLKIWIAAAWEDYDNDGDPDLYVGNDAGRNNLYRNDKGRFVDVAADMGIEDMSAGMSVSWADFNHDNLMDLYVGNMFSSAGNRITRQTQKLSGFDPETLALIQRFAKGNSLFQNLGNGKFKEVSDPAGVEMGRWAWWKWR